MPDRDFERDELAVAESETRLEEPPLYKVLLHNDNFTTMEFVVYVLQTIFQRTESDSITIMLKVHQEGIGVAGIYTYEVAEMKVERVAALAEANEYPLLCTLEQA
ncbi:MAG TPA: ATP-dependent Clp protease adaptor ClpS [Pyrinomonadaceae bacterium]|jgi:ATP-dependent Clp protease adaptor protein ClpS